MANAKAALATTSSLKIFMWVSIEGPTGYITGPCEIKDRLVRVVALPSRATSETGGWSATEQTRRSGARKADPSCSTCGGCTSNVTHALKSVAGVDAVDVSLAGGKATVRYDELQTSPDLLKAHPNVH